MRRGKSQTRLALERRCRIFLHEKAEIDEEKSKENNVFRIIVLMIGLTGALGR